MFSLERKAGTHFIQLTHLFYECVLESKEKNLKIVVVSKIQT